MNHSQSILACEKTGSVLLLFLLYQGLSMKRYSLLTPTPRTDNLNSQHRGAISASPYSTHREAWPVLPQVRPRLVKRAATGHFLHAEQQRNLSKLVCKDGVQQEDSLLERRQLLQHEQRGQHDRRPHANGLEKSFCPLMTPNNGESHTAIDCQAMSKAAAAERSVTARLI
jgi:hypothetical protein